MAAPGQNAATPKPPEPAQGPGAGSAGAGPAWKRAWQLPLLAAGAAGVAGAAYVAFLWAPKPDYNGLFGRAEAAFKGEEYGEAIEAINLDVRPHLEAGHLSPEQSRRYYLTVARALALGQRKLGIDRDENNQGIVAYYEQAEREHAALEATDEAHLAHALIALKRLDAARARADAIDGASIDLKVEVYRRLITAAMAPPLQNDAAALDLLTRLGSDEQLPLSDRAWVAARQTQIVLDRASREEPAVGRKFAQDAIARLHRAWPKLQDADPRQKAELLALLGRAYLETGSTDDARKWLDEAGRGLSGDDPLMARVLLMQGLADFGTDKAKAEERYALIVEKFGSSPEYQPALLGLAEALAFQGSHDQAAERYEDLVRRIKADGPTREVSRERVLRSLLSKHDDRMGVGEFASALRYASLGEDLFEGDEAPAELVLRLAAANRALGDEALRVSGVDAGSITAADPATQAMARRYFLEAGERYRAHAERVIVSDNAAHGASLWASAEMFDRAGDLDSATDTLRRFVTGFPGDDRLPEAKHRLAGAELARSDHASAERLYRELLQDRGTAAGAGVFADASVVPLARTLLSDSRAENDDEARELLASAVTGQYGGPESPVYREALGELGLLNHRAGRYPEAIEVFREYLGRYAAADAPQGATHGAPHEEPASAHGVSEASHGAADHGAEVHAASTGHGADDAHGTDHASGHASDGGSGHGADHGTEHGAGGVATHGPSPSPPGVLEVGRVLSDDAMRYRLADCLRLNAITIEDELRQGQMPESQRRELAAARVAQLTEAAALFERVRDGLGARPRKGAVERTYERNAHFYLGECAFELEDYEGAIRHYDAARERYAHDPAALVGMVQIVSAYRLLGDVDKARTANERARRFFERLPEHVWEDPSLPMGRAQWEGWLESSEAMSRRADAAESPGG